MGDEGGSVRVSGSNSVDHIHNDDQGRQLDIYPLSCYYFGSKEAIPLKDETLADRVQRLKSNYAAYGLRTCVEAVILVELFKHPHILLLQVRNCIFKLPGGRLRPGELEIDGLKRKLSRKLCVNADGDGIAWEVGECLDVWWRPDFETLLCRDLPSIEKNPKECTKLFLVKLPESRKFIVPKNLKLLAIPLCQINKNREVYFDSSSGTADIMGPYVYKRKFYNTWEFKYSQVFKWINFSIPKNPPCIQSQKPFLCISTLGSREFPYLGAL